MKDSKEAEKDKLMEEEGTCYKLQRKESMEKKRIWDTDKKVESKRNEGGRQGGMTRRKQSRIY